MENQNTRTRLAAFKAEVLEKFKDYLIDKDVTLEQDGQTFLCQKIQTQVKQNCLTLWLTFDTAKLPYQKDSTRAQVFGAGLIKSAQQIATAHNFESLRLYPLINQVDFC